MNKAKYSEVAEAYGIAVRAGLITPCLQDENAFRAMLGLQPAPDVVVAYWKTIGGTKQPITLQSGKTQAAEADVAESEADANE